MRVGVVVGIVAVLLVLVALIWVLAVLVGRWVETPDGDELDDEGRWRP